MRSPELEEIIRRYLAGESTYAIGASLGVTGKAIKGRLQRAGVPRRPPGTPRLPRGDCEVCGEPLTRLRSRRHGRCRRRYPLPTPRVCECGCGCSFTPQAVHVARGAGRFATYACWNRWRTGRPQAEWRARDF
jgi:hypothetical protein